MKANQPPAWTEWRLEVSHLVGISNKMVFSDLPELRRWVQSCADNAPIRKGIPPYGQISFRYDLDEDDTVNCIHAMFRNRSGVKSRFMRLRREGTNVDS